MKKKLLSQITKLAMLTFAAAIIVTGSNAMTVHAFNWDDYDNYDNGGGLPAYDSEDDFTKKQEEQISNAEEQAKANEMLTSDKYADVNTLNATVKVSANILKAKKKAGSYVKQLPNPSKVTVDGKALKINKDYTLTYGVYTQSGWQTANGLTSPGLYRIWVQGKGLYNGTLTKAFRINRAPITADMVNEKGIEVKYTGKAVKPEVTLKNGSTASDNAVTAPETQSDEEPAIPGNSISEDADTNTKAA